MVEPAAREFKRHPVDTCGEERQAGMISKRWIEYCYVISDLTTRPCREWTLQERLVMDADFQPRASRLADRRIAEGRLIAYVLVNCDEEGLPLILEVHDDLANHMFKQRLPGARLT